MLTIREAAKELGVKEISIRTYMNVGGKLEKVKENGKLYVTKSSVEEYKKNRPKLREYALYKGDELLGIGTAKELSEQLGLTVQTIRWYATPSAQRIMGKDGRTAIKLD